MRVKISDNRNKQFIYGYIKPIKKNDLEVISLSGQFKVFEWNNFVVNFKEMYKLELNGEILGIIWFYKHALFNLIIIEKIEVKIDIWKNKEYSLVGGCLISFACLYSLNNCSGEIELIPKKEVRNHYKVAYKMKAIRENDGTEGRILELDKTNSECLVRKFLEQLV